MGQRSREITPWQGSCPTNIVPMPEPTHLVAMHHQNGYGAHKRNEHCEVCYETRKSEEHPHQLARVESRSLRRRRRRSGPWPRP